MSNQNDHKISHSLVLAWIVCGFGALFYCYEYFLRIEPSVMVGELMREFHVTAESLGFLAALYYWAYTPMQLVVGVLTDRYGPRRILTFAVAACAVGSAIFGFAPTVFIAGIGRFLIGLGSAFAFVGVLKLAAIWLPRNRFSLFAGLATALGMVGAMIGDTELTMMVYRLGWQHTVAVGTVVGIILVPIIWLVVRDDPNANKSSLTSQRHLHRVETYQDALRGLVGVIKNPQMWVIGVIGCMLYLSLSVFAELWGIPLLEKVYHFTPQRAAFLNSLIFLGWLVGAPVNGWISDRAGSRHIPLLIGTLMSALMISLILWTPITSVTLVGGLLFFFGVFSSVEIVCFTMSRENNPIQAAGTAIAFTNLMVMLSGMIFQPLVGKLLDVFWDGRFIHGIPLYAPGDYKQAMVVIPIALLIAAVLTFFLRETYGEGEQYEIEFK